MKNYRPLLLQNIRLSLPGLTVHRLRLNLHTPESQQWSEHAHEHGQILVYLAGRGRQKLAGKFYDCRPGTVVHVAPQTPHAFERQQVRMPLCLVLDVELNDRQILPMTVQLPQAALTQIRAAVARLFQLRQIEVREMMLKVSAVLLEILDPVLLAIGWLKPVNRFGNAAMLSPARVVQRTLERMDDGRLPLAELAKKTGYQPGVLNATLRKDIGLTFGQLRARIRLKKAMDLLQKGRTIAAAATGIGMDDQNYFARWFRQQTGMTPSAWKKNPKPLQDFG